MIALLALVARHGRLAACAALGVAILAAALMLYGAGRRAGVSAEAPKVVAAQAAAAAAQDQTQLTGEAAKAADVAATHGARAAAQAEEAAHDVQTAPGATTALPPDVLARWRAGVDGLRPSRPADADRADR